MFPSGVCPAQLSSFSPAAVLDPLSPRPPTATRLGHKSEYTALLLQVPDHGRALSEGTVLCLEDRRVVGAVEEVFGPILSPLYAFRWAGRGQQAAEVAAGARVFTTARLAHYVAEESLQTKVSAQPGGEQLSAVEGLGEVSLHP